ncbi:glycosyltransferase [Litchfieldia alkalitelluris]|uniref:glycosyltransferase n=1 Tax=Litchfieldia alkalitelluris TaxID=304268 RepID=UPI0009960FA2|nr:glycosyltransferase [Litchfieldia alkalitelluris]
MKRVLVLVGESLSANGICANAVMNELKIKGYEVICLTNQEFNQKNRENKKGVKIEKVKPRLTYRMNFWCKNHGGFLSRLIKKVSFILNKAKLVISIPTWPLISPFYTYRFYKSAKKLYKNHKYDCIISIYTQIDTVIAGYFIKKKYPEVKFIPYFLDSLSGGYGPKMFSKQWVIKRGLTWERKLLKIADKIIIMKSSERHHQIYSNGESYYSRIKVLDIPLLTSLSDKDTTTDLLDNKKTNIVYVGSIPCHIRNPKYSLEVFKKLNIENCRLTIIGTNTCPDLIKKAQEDSKKNEIVLIDQISHEEVISALRSADVLLNIGNNIASMVPSKIFEYMSVGKPILSFYPIENDPSIKYLEHYPLSLSVKEDWNELKDNVLKVENFIKGSCGKTVNLEEFEEKMYKNTPKAFVEELEKIFI